MIFITVGSQKFQFNRLLQKLDSLIEQKIITGRVFAQIGYSDYIPKNFEYVRFMDKREFNDMILESTIIITHGGTGSIINAIKNGKKVIATPRLKKYDEHVDNHQVQIINQFVETNLVLGCFDLEQLGETIVNIENRVFSTFKSNTNTIINDIERFIES